VLTELALDEIRLVDGKAVIRRLYGDKHLGTVQGFSIDSKAIRGQLTIKVTVQRLGAPDNPQLGTAGGDNKPGPNSGKAGGPDNPQPGTGGDNKPGPNSGKAGAPGKGPTLSGVVEDASGRPLPKATVFIRTAAPRKGVGVL
jgi:hypothetical protein